MPRAASVRVPATSANLGPGFDTLGLALELVDEVTAEESDAGLEIEVEGEGASVVPRDERHLVVRAMARAYAALTHSMTAYEPPSSCRIDGAATCVMVESSRSITAAAITTPKATHRRRCPEPGRPG